MSDVLELLVVFQISVNGSPLDDAKRDALLDAVVEQSSELPDACTLRFGVSVFQDDGEALLASNVFTEGSALKVEARNLQSTLATLFEGEIVGVELDLSTFGPSTLTVRALHAAHRLMRGQKQLTFLNQTDGDIFKKVAAAAGLTTTDNSSSSTVYPYTIQDNLTDWDFLQLLARRNGSRVSCGSDKKVVFDGFSSQTADVSVKWAEDLLSFRPRTHGAGQIDSVEVRGWDPKTKKAVVGTANDTALGVPSAGTTVSSAKKDFSSAKHYLTNQAVTSQAEATALATSTLRRLRGRFLQMEALCEGNPDIAPGKNLKVDNVGSRFNGKYPITSAVHTFSPSEGYRTQVFSSGRDPEGLLPALSGGGSNGALHGTGMGMGSFATAIVTDNNDAEKMGRVKVKFPALSETQESFWCRLVSPMAGAARGFLFIPEINDEVLVAFEQGSPHLPYVLGQLWNGTDAIPDDMAKAVAGGKVERRTIKTRVGHTITLDDSDGKRSVEVITKDGHNLLFDDIGKKIEAKTKDGHFLLLDDTKNILNLKDKTGQNEVLIESNPGNITINAKGNIAMTSATGNIDIHAKLGNITTTADVGNVASKAKVGRLDTEALQGSTFKVAAAKFDLTPVTAEMNSPTSSVKGTIATIVQGLIVKIN